MTLRRTLGLARRRYWRRARLAMRRPVLLSAARRPGLVPDSVLGRLLGAETAAALEARRVEIGSGIFAASGFLHLDDNPTLASLDLRSDAGRIPLPTGWAHEMLAVHVLEHIPAHRLGAVLEEWRRVLRPGGTLEVHVPNGDVLARELIRSDDPAQYWRLQNNIFGYWAAPESTTPDELRVAPDHKLLFTPLALERALSDAGFVDLVDVSGTTGCRHDVAWRSTLPGMCLEMRATAPS